MKMIKDIKLCVMMFLQFMLVAVFWVQLSSYLDSMKITGTMMSLIMSSMAIGSIFSPLVGAFADRIANGEKVLAFLNALVALCLVWAYFSTSAVSIFVSITLAMCAYMPSWGLTTTIALRHSSSETFPFIRVFGSLGWVCSALFALAAKQLFDTNIDGTAIPLACGAGIAAFAAVFSLLLPHTPPADTSKKISLPAVLGLGAFSILRDRNVAVLILCEVLYTIAFTIYWMYGSFLASLGIAEITPILNVGQISEMLFMLLLPVSIKYLGIKNTIAIGLGSMALRYFASIFGGDYSAGYWTAICLHGLVFGFFIVAAQIYIGKKAPEGIQAQAQGFFYLVYGIAQTLGTFFSVWLINVNSTVVNGVRSTDWASLFTVEAIFSAAILVLFVAAFKSEKISS